jgi:hypothetical protein
MDAAIAILRPNLGTTQEANSWFLKETDSMDGGESFELSVEKRTRSSTGILPVPVWRERGIRTPGRAFDPTTV